MNIIYIQSFKTVFGELILGSFNEQLCLCDWKYRKMRVAIDNRISNGFDASFEEKETEIIYNTKVQLTEYFNKQREEFFLPLVFVGTEFQKEVWKALQLIPYGKTYSYMELAILLNQPKAIRAIAAANGANAISIIVPCHRIIGSNGKLVGYAGGLDTKDKLLKLEQSDIQPSLFS